jgi:GalNAc-alpha-(1->4)-GalNAc-alpha-(1->3)-diNAcBac-PP-undecaprenol alpha-1,4-N-acetyl-D-galactosaminyltransferase
MTLVIWSLDRGGAERIMSVLASAWAEHGREVTLIVFDGSLVPAYPLQAGVKLRSLGVSNQRASNFFQAVYRNARRVRTLRRAIRQAKPDVVITFLDISNVLTLLATRGLGVPVIVSERANPTFVDIGAIWGILRRLTYPFANTLVCQTSAMVALVQRKIKIAGYAIPNPVALPSTPGNHEGRDPNSRIIIAMGRLVPQKGFDLLLDAFSRIADGHPDWSLKILGQGPMKEELEAQAEGLGLKNRVCFMGTLADPFPVLRAADLFVFSSRFEGFGNALSEAMACGLPAISFDCPAGPSDIIRHGVDGILVPPEDVTALADAMDRLMSDAGERARLARRAPEVLERFSLERVLASWDELFGDVVPGHKLGECKAGLPDAGEDKPHGGED